MATKQPVTRPINIPLPGASQIIASGRGCVRRLAVRETTGTASALVRFYDGNGTNGVEIDVISLAPGESARDFYKCAEYPFEGSLYYQLASGAVEGCCVVQYIGPGWPFLEPMLALTLSDIATLEGTTLGSLATATATPATATASGVPPA